MAYKLAIQEISKLFNNEIHDDTLITGISYNSKEVKDGDIFVCLVGEKTDGHNFVDEAKKNGAKALLVSSDVSINDIPIIKVENTQVALAKLSSIFYGEPTKKLDVIGVTGTNGKTTTTHLIQHILESENLKAAVIGTLGTRESTSSLYYDAKHTTPQSPELQKHFFSLSEKGFSHIAMEVSSHALSLHRVDNCDFKGAVFTNLTQDHLDFHLTMEAYFLAKKKLFEMLNTSSKKKKYAIINVDDMRGKDIISTLNDDILIYTYSVTNKSDFQAKNINFNSDGVSFELLSPEGFYKVASKLNGIFNVYNILAAIAATYAEGIKLEKIISSISSASEVPGRFQIFYGANISRSPICIVDYAHTPDGLENILKSARLLVKKNKKLICVFGCGGDRDSTKRPKMGKIAEKLSDMVVITSDNPRSEDPKQIISDILSGIKNTVNVVVEPDRHSAIKYAVENSNPEDIVVIAGKGHEDYQILKDKTIHFDDRDEVAKCLNDLTSY